MFVQVLRTILQIGGISLFYWMGMWIQHMFHAPIPGSMIGLFLLLFFLFTGILRVKWLQSGADLLLSWLPLLFLPSVIGVIEYLGFLKQFGLETLAVVFVSTVLVMGFSGLMAQWLAKRKEDMDEGMDKRDPVNQRHSHGVHRDETSL